MLIILSKYDIFEKEVVKNLPAGSFPQENSSRDSADKGKRRNAIPGCDRPIFFVQLFLSSFSEKLDFWMSDSKSNLAVFSEILKIWSRKFLKNSHEIRLFIFFFRAI